MILTMVMAMGRREGRGERIQRKGEKTMEGERVWITGRRDERMKTLILLKLTRKTRRKKWRHHEQCHERVRQIR
jgi:hypothetical protein